MSKEIVSVIIPVYNRGKIIETAIASVQMQTYSSLQIIVIDDGSEDDTYEIIKKIAREDQRILLLRNKTNLGVVASRNLGCSKAVGRYIAFLDSDDRWYPEKIELQLNYLKQTKAHICYTSYEMIGKDDRAKAVQYIVPSEVDYKAILKENCICCSSVLIHKDLLGSSPFSSGYFHEDFVLWLSLLKQGYRAVGIMKCLMVYRLGGRSSDKINAMYYRWLIYRKHEHLSLLMTTYYFICYGINGIRKYYLNNLREIRVMIKIIKRIIYKIYKRFQHITLIATITQYLYHRVLPLLGFKERAYHYISSKEEPLENSQEVRTDIKQLTIAIICDEITFRGFEAECRCLFVTPSNWMQVFRRENPDLFFCEAAWHGIEQYYDSWRGKIYKAGKTKFENRRELLDILDFCKKSHIPTVFWNKEDSAYFGNKEYDFVDTALKFDYIYTTAKECVEEYKKLGHENVDVLMFGFAPRLFNPMGRTPKDNEVVFAGSWYGDQEDRCQDMRKIFDEVLQKRLTLKIYDRQWQSSNPIHQFPKQYRKYVQAGVAFRELNEVLKEAQYAINVNTVKNSSTMFARRVFEMMASNIILISNDSIGMRRLFQGKVWFVGEDFDQSKVRKIARHNLEYVFLYHTCRQRLVQVGEQLGLIKKQVLPYLYVIYNKKSTENEKHFKRINYEMKIGLIYRENQFYDMANDIKLKREGIDDLGFVIWINNLEKIPNIAFMLTQFSYIEEDCGIYEGQELYNFAYDSNNYEVLFKVGMLDLLLENFERITKKYII